MVLVTSDGFRGAYLGSRHGFVMTAIAGEGTAMERDYDYSPRAARGRPRIAGDRSASTAGERAVERLNPRKVRHAVGAGRVRSAGRGLARRPSRRRDQRQRRSRAARASSRTSWAQQLFAPASASSTIRCASAACARGRSTPKASRAAARADRRRRADDLAARLRIGARSSGSRPPAMRRAASSSAALAVRDQPLHLEPGTLSPDDLIADIARRLLRHRLIGMGVNGSPATTAAAPPGSGSRTASSPIR